VRSAVESPERFDITLLVRDPIDAPDARFLE
jgi:hypothetical protein